MQKENRGALIGGLILILGGALALAGQFIPDSWGFPFILLVLLGLGVVFLTAGIATREAGWIIPGGILSGIGAGIALVDGPLTGLVPGDEGGLFMLAFAGGWFLITLLTGLFTDETHWWALIPGGIMALIGLAAGYGSIFAWTLEALGRVWPIALIVVGLVVLFRSRHPQKGDVQNVSDLVEKA